MRHMRAPHCGHEHAGAAIRGSKPSGKECSWHALLSNGETKYMQFPVSQACYSEF